jgi:transglutaminase-like putative cysteine protease
LIFAAALLGCGPAYAANNQVQRAPVPNWVVPSELLPVPEGASGLVFVRRHDVLVHLDAQGETQYAGYQMKILHANALQMGNLSIAWNPSAGAPTVHAIRVHRDGQAIDVLKSASFEILRREDQLEEASLNGVLTAILRVPDLRVGDELEVAFTTRLKDPTLGADAAGLLVLGADPAPGRFRLGLSWDEGQEPKLKMAPHMAKVAARRDRAVEFAFDNPTPLIPPKDAPARYAWQRVVEYSDFSDWASISRHFAPLFAKSASLRSGSPLKDQVKRIAAAHPGALERAGAALKLVQQEVRYIYVGLDGGNLMPAAAEETWKRRYGDCKGKTALLLGLLAELGIEAEPVLVSNSGADDGLDERLPSPRMFDHVLVRARIDGSDYWLDGTLPPVAEPSSVPVMPYRWTLPLTAQGKSIEQLRWRVPETPDEITLFEIDARAGFDQPARITTMTIVRGIKGLEQQAQLSGVAPAQLLSGMRQQMIGDTWQSIEAAQWRYDPKARASVMTISGTGTVEWDDDGDGAKSLALPGGGFSPPEKRIRPSDQDQNLPYYSKPEFECHVTTVRLPQSTRPSHWSFNTSFDTRLFGRNYYRAFERREGSIRMVRGSRVEQPEIDAASARRDNAKIGAFDNSMAWIHYTPAGGGSDADAGARVPASYEIDWTADQVPCLSAGAALK